MLQSFGMIKESKNLLPFGNVPTGGTSREDGLCSEGDKLSGFEKIFSDIAERTNAEKDKKSSLRVVDKQIGKSGKRDRNVSENVELEQLRLRDRIKDLLRKFLKLDGSNQLTKSEFEELINQLERFVKSLLQKLKAGEGKKEDQKLDNSSKRGVTLEGFLKRFLNILEGLKNSGEKESKKLLELLGDLLDDLDNDELAKFLEETGTAKKESDLSVKLGEKLKGDSLSRNTTVGIVSDENFKNIDGTDKKRDPIEKLQITDLRSKGSSHGRVKSKGKKHTVSKFFSESKSNRNSRGTGLDGKLNSGVKGISIGSVARTAFDGNSQASSTAHVPRGFSNIIERIRELLEAKGFKRGNIVVRDGGNGEIRLVLKPKSLGNVRIKLNILDNRIEGKIFVENNSVRGILNSNISSLRDALREGGFQSAFLEVSVNGEPNNSREERESFKSSIGHNRRIVDEIDSIVPGLVEIERDDLVIDMVV